MDERAWAHVILPIRRGASAPAKYVSLPAFISFHATVRKILIPLQTNSDAPCFSKAIDARGLSCLNTDPLNNLFSERRWYEPYYSVDT